MMLEIKPCPFCGQRPHIDFVNRIVECVNPSCAVVPSTWKYDFVSEALDAWNTRNERNRNDD